MHIHQFHTHPSSRPPFHIHVIPLMSTLIFTPFSHTTCLHFPHTLIPVARLFHIHFIPLMPTPLPTSLNLNYPSCSLPISHWLDSYATIPMSPCLTNPLHFSTIFMDSTPSPIYTRTVAQFFSSDPPLQSTSCNERNLLLFQQGWQLDPNKLDVVAGLKVPYVAMHMRGNPSIMMNRDKPHYWEANLNSVDAPFVWGWWHVIARSGIRGDWWSWLSIQHGFCWTTA